MFCAPLANWITRRYHYKLTMSIGLVLQGGSFLCASFATKVSVSYGVATVNQVDMAIISNAGCHVRNRNGFVIRGCCTFAKSMVYQKTCIGNGHLRSRVRGRRTFVLYLYESDDSKHQFSLGISNQRNSDVRGQ